MTAQNTDGSGTAPVSVLLGSVVSAVESAVDGVARHWLTLAVIAVGLFWGLAFAAPWLSMNGFDRAADVIYFAYRITCHQLPHRSWFMGGEALAYDWTTVHTHLGLGANDVLGAFHNPVRDPVLGHQTAFCQREVAIFGSFLLILVLFGLFRNRYHIRAISFKVYLLALVPIGVDGVTQLVGLRESTPFLRTTTGAIFGIATALLVVPQLELGFGDMLTMRKSAPPDERPPDEPPPDSERGGTEVP